MTRVPTTRPSVALVAAAVTGLLVCAAWTGASLGQGARTPSPPGAMVYFIDIKNGDSLPSRSIVHFGLRGMGVAPAGSDHENSGHHHLLIDTELPPLDQPIPNDFNHLHFGSGQTEAEVTLAPGDHTLQLLLGDRAHVPHSPPVMSEPIRVHIVDAGAGTAAGRHPSPANANVYFVHPTDGDVVSRTPVVRFGLENMGVAPAGVDKLNTGHHHLLIDAPLPEMDRPIPDDASHLHFGAGQTEAQITLTPGTHTLRLLLGDENHMPHVPPVYSKPITVSVATPGGHKRRHRPHPHRIRPSVRHDDDSADDNDDFDTKPPPIPFLFPPHCASSRCQNGTDGDR